MMMYKEIEKIIVRTLSPFEYEKLEDLKNNYTAQQIIGAYKKYGDKPINYISKVVGNIKQTPEWLYTNITNEPIDEKTKKDFEDFKKFLEDFRNENYKENKE